MEINETTILDDRGFVKINGDEAKSFLQNIVTNDIEKITDSLTLFSSIFTPQGKYCLLYTSPSPRDRSLSRMPSSA